MISSENSLQQLSADAIVQYMRCCIVYCKVVDTPEAILIFHSRICQENCLRRALTMISRNWLKSALARMSQTQFRQRSILTDSWMEACRILCVDSRLEAQVYMGAHCSFLSPPWCGQDSSTSSY